MNVFQRVANLRKRAETWLKKRFPALFRDELSPKAHGFAAFAPGLIVGLSLMALLPDGMELVGLLVGVAINWHTAGWYDNREDSDTARYEAMPDGPEKLAGLADSLKDRIYPKVAALLSTIILAIAMVRG